MTQRLAHLAAPRKGSSSLTILLLTALPLVYALRGSFIIWGRYFSPDHAHWADPDYTYLYNGLLFATGNEIRHVDHPGTPLQLLNAALIWSLWKFRLIQSDTQTLEAHTLATADSYLILISLLLLAAQCISLFLLGLVVKISSNLTLAVLAQLPALAISLGLARDLLSNKPEGFIFILAALTLIALIISARNPIEKSRLQRLTLLVAVLLGLMMALKISSLPIALLLPLLFWKKDLILRTYGLTLLFTIVFLSPVVFLYRSILGFWMQFRGQAQSGVVDTLLLKDTTVLLNAPFVVVSFFVALGGVIFWLTRPHEGRNRVLDSTTITWKYLLRYSLILAAILLLQMVLANSRGAWWVIPALPVAGVALAVGLSPLVAFAQKRHQGDPPMIAVISGVVAITIFFSVTSAQQVFKEAALNQANTLLTTERALHARPNSTLIYDWSIGWHKTPLGGECGALVFGVGPEFSAALKDRCPRTWLANFSYEEILPFGSNWAGCRDIESRLNKQAELYLFKPAQAPMHKSLRLNYLAGNAEWNLYELDAVVCP